MKAFVEPNLCIGCTLCATTCPDVYEMHGSLSIAIEGEIPPEHAGSAAEAAQNCPVDAIKLIY